MNHQIMSLQDQLNEPATGRSQIESPAVQIQQLEKSLAQYAEQLAQVHATQQQERAQWQQSSTVMQRNIQILSQQNSQMANYLNQIQRHPDTPNSALNLSTDNCSAHGNGNVNMVTRAQPSSGTDVYSQSQSSMSTTFPLTNVPGSDTQSRWLNSNLGQETLNISAMANQSLVCIRSLVDRAVLQSTGIRRSFLTP